MNKEWSELNKKMQAQIKKEETWQEGLQMENLPPVEHRVRASLSRGSGGY